MPTIVIDGKEYEVGEGRNVLQAALDNNLDLPYFCWHPAMGSVGACRLCAVKHYRDENDKQGRLTMGCMTPATDGTRVAIDEPEAAQFRRSVVEWLMINHPHDCPVCDEGGECHLQDMTVMTGHAHRRYRGQKRTYRNQDLGPLIHHEMNRCIQCYRCVRFYCDHTGGDDLGVFASRNRVYFGRVEDGVLESPFAGNLVEVCPTGVFTDKTRRKHYTRKWDLQSAPSICSHCGLGCNTLVGARYGSVRRVASRYNGEVNGYWLCDRGRFGYEYLNAADRLSRGQTPLRGSGPGAPGVDPTVVWNEAAEAIARAAAAGTLAAVGSPRAGLESNFALRALATPARFCAGLAEPERALVARYARAAHAGAFHVPSLQQVEKADAIVVLGADLTNEAPLLDLALYRSHDAGGAVFVIGLSPGRVGAFANAVERVDSDTAAARARSLGRALRHGSHGDPVAAALAGAQRPLVITGTQHRDAGLLQAALDLVDAIGAETGNEASFVLAAPEANSVGAVLLAAGDGLSVPALIDAIDDGAVTALVVGENDLFARFDNHRRLSAALQKLDALVVLDHMVTPTAALATHAWPVAATAESNGTLVNNEGRMQRFYQVLRPVDGVVPTWSVARDLGAAAAGADGDHVEDLTAALEATVSTFAGATQVAPPADFRYQRQPIPRMSNRYSGRNATIERDALDGLAARQAFESGGELPVVRRVSDDPETPLAFSMEGFSGSTPPALLPRVWAPGWNSNEAINQFQIEVGGPMHGGDPGLRIFGRNAGNAMALDDDGWHTALRGAAHPSSAAEDAIASAPDNGRFLLCAAAEIFASEATSQRAPALAELAPENYLRLHPVRAAALGLEQGTVRTLELSDGDIEATVEATIVLDAGLPAHVAMIPAGYPATRWWQQPLWMRIEPGEGGR